MASRTVTAIDLDGTLPAETHPSLEGVRPEPDLRFECLGDRAPEGARGPIGRAASVVAHVALAGLVLLVPLLLDDSLPDPGSASVKAFFATPLELAPPPPPPPPAPASAKAAPRAPDVARNDAFVAPVETPEMMPEATGLDLGMAGGEGGVEGGVPGGVIGGVVGGLPDAPPPAAPPVRIGGKVREPTKLKDVAPVYPDAAVQAGVQGVVILECLVNPQGRVTDVKVLRGVPLLDEAAVAAARQWVYTPTLMDGVPVPVIMTVTVRFDLRRR